MSEVHKDHVELKWNAPESDGGSPVTTYLIEKRDSSKNNWFSAGTVDGNKLEATVTKLFEGSDYFFRVSAENKIGVSEPAETKEPITAKLPYGMLLPVL